MNITKRRALFKLVYMLSGRDMNIINNNIKWIMLASGILTFTMVFAAITPQLALNSMFNSTLEGPLAEIIVRNWGALIAIIGGMLIYASLKNEVRNLALSVAVLSKIVFISLVITYGFGSQLLSAITFDAIFVLLFSIYLLSSRNNSMA